jgi:Ca-activated chloride channel family protein
VFAFGVGYDVNTFLLDRLSDAGRGATQYVRPGEDVEEAVGLLVAKVQHPVLADLELAHSPVELTEVYPERLPDLFAGEELVVFGRYRAARSDRAGDIVITGRRNDQAEQFGTEANFPTHAAGNDFIPQLWASRKIGYLSQAVRLNGPNEELIQEIRETALRYGLLSEYTSYLVQEPIEVALFDGSGAPRDMAARVPAAASGAVAVNAAEQARVRREARSKMEMQEAELDILKRAQGPNTRHVAGRLFLEKLGTWTDLMHADTLDIVEIAAFSDAYFKVLEQLPELRAYVTEFDQVLVAGEELSIKFSDDGSERLSPLRIGQLVKGFRGR